MKAELWRPAEFDYGYQRQSQRKRLEIWDSLTGAQKKLYLEWEMFRRFAKTSDPSIDLDSITMLNPDSAVPPAPDLACRRKGDVVFFELGEIIEEGVARVASAAQKSGRSTFGGVVSLWPAVASILCKK